jgi:hypothetical protein
LERERGRETSKRYETLEFLIDGLMNFLDTFPETGSLSDALPSIKTSTLRALSLAKVLNEACTCSINDLHAVIESAKLLSVFWPAVKSKLYKEPKLVSQFPAACQLLTMVLENEATIDLSPFDLSAEQIHQILLERPSQSREVTSLNLSGKLLDEDLFRKVLASSPSIRTLYLLDTPHIPLRTKFSLLQGTRVSELYDSELYRRPFIEKRPKRSNRPPPKLDPVPTYINPPVVQMVLVACGHATGESGHLRDYVRFPDGGLDLSKLLEHTGGFRFCHSEPLTELNLSPNSVLFGLGQYLQYFTSGDNDNTLSLHESRHDVGPVLGMSLALNVEGKEYKVGPVCDALYRHYDNMGWPTGVRNPVEISADEWTFVLVSEPGSVPGYLRMPTKRYPTLRYAFITVKGQGTADSVVIADAEMFIEHVMPGKEAEQMRREVLSDWNKHVENRYLEDDPENGMKLCGRKEIESLLRSSAFCVLEKKGEEAVVDN